MKIKNFKWILYLIVLVIIGTIAIQVYWNYKNYQTNKQQLVNDVQVSLDNAIDSYYENLAKTNTLGFTISEDNHEAFFKSNGKLATIFDGIDIKSDGFTKLDTTSKNLGTGITIIKGRSSDSLFPRTLNNESNLVKWEISSDSLRQKSIENLTSKVFISITNDSLKLKEVDSLLMLELHRKNLNIDYGITFKEHMHGLRKYHPETIDKSELFTVSKSTFLPPNSELKLYFKNETKIILKRILSGILISTLLVLALISCLFYLLKIINHQKQLAEVKNDLISNITHEFKTPIATIGVALESIKDFNVLEDKEKTKKYLNLSSNQLSKLNIMVEKLLETATLDSENISLNKEEINISDLISTIIDKYKIQTLDKTIAFESLSETILAKVDIFHFENAINNIIDNAIKYGGDSISVKLNQNNQSFSVEVSDNGNTLTKANKENIFEKFYRIPKGNIHDVKGFGIGLYYTKKIIEKHGGKIQLDLNNKLTSFNLSIPNE